MLLGWSKLSHLESELSGYSPTYWAAKLDLATNGLSTFTNLAVILKVRI